MLKNLCIEKIIYNESDIKEMKKKGLNTSNIDKFSP